MMRIPSVPGFGNHIQEPARKPEQPSPDTMRTQPKPVLRDHCLGGSVSTENNDLSLRPCHTAGLERAKKCLRGGVLRGLIPSFTPADLRAKGVIASGVIAGRTSSRRYPSSREFGARPLGRRTSAGLPDHTAVHSEGRPDSPSRAVSLVRPKQETRGGVRESRPARWRTLSNTIRSDQARSQTTPAAAPAGTSAATAYAFSGEGNQCRPHSSIVSKPKDPIPTDTEKGIVYKIPCQDCGSSYIGETGREKITRMKEHQRDVKYSTNATRLKTELVDHAWTTGHTFDFIAATTLAKEDRLRNKAAHPEASTQSVADIDSDAGEGTGGQASVAAALEPPIPARNLWSRIAPGQDEAQELATTHVRRTWPLQDIGIPSLLNRGAEQPTRALPGRIPVGEAAQPTTAESRIIMRVAGTTMTISATLHRVMVAADARHTREGDRETGEAGATNWTSRVAVAGRCRGPSSVCQRGWPIFIRLRGHKITAPKRTTSVVCWDAFRAELEQTPVTTSGGDPKTHELAHLLRTIHEAKRPSTQQFQVAEDKPSSDLHLANLWQQRLDALCAYRERGRTPGLRCRLNLITVEARDYANTLSTDIWCDLCSSFNGNICGPRIWHIFRNWQGKAKRRTAAQTATLRMRISEEQLALQAGAVFFPQPAASPDPTIYSRDSVTPTQMIGDFQALDLQAPEQVDMDQPFQMAELHAALARANYRSAPGPHLITISELRNLPELHLQLLLDAINEIWTTGNFLSSWRESLVIPIPKPGKPPNELTNLRPISLTSNLCKLTERMVLERLMWHLERNSPLHPHQLGFRHGMSTQDILLMLRHQTRTVVAVDVHKAFDTIPHEAVIQSAELAGVCGHLLNFVKSFLNDRTTGVPQGVVLSPTLFNLVMARLTPLLEAVPSLHFAVYADDVTIWATTGSAGEQEHTLQLGLDVIQGFLRNWGTRERETRQLVTALLESRIFYGYNYHVLTPRQAEQLEKLNREAIRIVTGLPKHTPLRELYAHGGMNLLSELAEQALLAQRDRLSSSTAGLSILEELRVSPSLGVRPADAHSPPPWAAPVTLTDGKPLPRNMGPGPSNSERRKRFAKAHTRSVAHKSPPTHTIIYTDMAETLLSTAGDDGEGEDRTPKHVQAVAWVDTTHGIPNAAALSTTEDVDTTQVDLMALLRASQWVLQNFAPTDIPHRLLLFTDSTRAYETCRRASGSPSTYTGIVGELLSAFLEL
ncbi:hypothetical protein HPB47_028207 [Ixodes persulcatus]|uniref:Uncharacterized protein n=1 Tax=Ixodes persulcatus TaxID=34615 RepID=A0AC60PTY5_IXOPE|nr:hypothetical protein HPB47_028207 [Ixodes persulcatus]